jgi:uncharacterized protein (TIGR03437 family)
MRRILAMRLVSGNVLLAFLLTTAVHAQPQIGGGVCNNATLSGIYYYLLSGDLLSGNTVYPYVELGKLVANGQGGVSGNSHASIGGSISAYTLSGTYSVQSNCTGSMALSVNSQSPSSITFQVTSGGQSAIVAFSSSSGVVAGRAYRQTAATGTIQCATASLSGSYAYLLTGVAFISGNGYYYSQAGSATGDGLGNLNASGMVNVNGNTLASTGQGPYSVTSDCSGTASVKNQNGTANYFIAVAEDGQVVLFMESDSGYTVGGVANPIFVTPQSAVVNAASFDAGALSPGAIFSIFGKGLQQSAASGQVLVNGETAPVFFANGSQINAQIPFDVPTGRSVSLRVLSGGTPSNTVLVSLQAAAPGVFTSSGNHAVAQNADYSVNSPSNPAHVGDFVTLYLTGGGPVSPAVPTGVLAPSVPLSNVSATNSVSIGGLQAFVYFLGLTPGFEGLYQANVQVPSLAPGDYAVVVTAGGVPSNGPLISIR